ncbi:MAG: hypothetical protein U5Q03_18055 [Bacteroidota bacterium]|nr:hypothetical protein [Bacteroidota bacterium]
MTPSNEETSFDKARFLLLKESKEKKINQQKKEYQASSYHTPMGKQPKEFKVFPLLINYFRQIHLLCISIDYKAKTTGKWDQ